LPTDAPPGSLALVAASRDGARLAARLGQAWPSADRYVLARYLSPGGAGARPIPGPLKAVVPDLFAHYRALVFFLPVGAVVRLIGPHLRDKLSDPAVVAVDDGARFAVSLLSGHAGGANELAKRVAEALGAQPVVTTSVERRGAVAPELIGRRFGWKLEASREALLRASVALANGEPIAVYREPGQPEWLSPGLPHRRFRRLELLVASRVEPAIVVTRRELAPAQAARYVIWRPRDLVAGIGCSSGATADELEALLRSALAELGVAPGCLAAIATIDRKLVEPGLVELAARLQLPLNGYAAAELAEVAVPNPSAVVQRVVATPSVAEAAALRLANAPRLLLEKRTSARGVVALAQRSTGHRRRFPLGSGPSQPAGRLKQ
jgi:cobalt-precorrin 5A hydrolase